MEYALELLSFVGIGEHEIAHRLAIQAAVVVEHGIAEGIANLDQRGSALCYDLSCDDIRIDDWYAKVGKEISDGSLAAGDATSKPDAQWTWL